MLFIGEIKENEDEDEEVFEATDIESPPKRGCGKNGTKGPSC